MSDIDDEDVVGCVLGFLILFVHTPLALLAEAFIVKSLWAWFIVPLGVVSIPFWHALGFSILWAWLSPKVSLYHMDEDQATIIKRKVIWWLGAGMYLGMGYVVHLLM